jgi:Arrestin (or S-antigen), N-terminal domain
MALSIVLDGPSTATFSADDIVKGRVILQSQKDEAVGRVSIAFKGRTRTAVYRRQHADNRIHRSHAEFFHFTQKLYQGHYTLRANTYEWPFEFRFPAQTDPNATSTHTFKASPPLRSSSDVHPLPPTFSHNTSWFESYIGYNLEATLARQKMFASNLDSILPLNYMSYRNADEPPLGWKYTKKIFTAQTLRLLPEKVDAKLSMKEKMRSTFKSSELPSAKFCLKLRYPTQIHPGDQPIIHLSVQHLASTCPGNPPVTLKYATAEIKSTIQVRSPGLATDHHDHGTRRHQILRRYGLSIPVPESDDSEPTGRDFTGWLNLNENGMNTQSLQQNFGTYNIAVSNRLDVVVKVACADKLFKFSSDLPVVVLSPPYIAHAALVRDGETEVLVPPPVYEHVPEYEEVAA